MENVACRDEALGNNGQQIGSMVQFASPQSLGLCKCKKTCSETRDAETQTVDIPKAETCDAGTQWCFIADSVSKAPGFNLYLPSVHMSVQYPATGRQTDTAEEPNTGTSSSENLRSEGKCTPQCKRPTGGSLSGSSIINKFSAKSIEDKVVQQRQNCF